jgi:ubiquinone biosynthesis protein
MTTLVRAGQVLWAFGRRNLFWGLYRDLYRGHVTNRDCGCHADRAIERRAVRLRQALEELGPTFVKLGQVLSRRPDLVPPAYVRELEKLQDRAAALPFVAIQRQLTARCICTEQLHRKAHDSYCLHCHPLDKVLDAFDRRPVATASLAQVHRAIFRGHPVAVKILRPGVLDRINVDFAVLRRLPRLLLGALGLPGNVDARAFVADFRRRLLAEVDLEREGLSIERFRANRDPEATITAPAVFPEFRRSDLLVMEFVEGQPIGAATAEWPRAKRRKLAETLVRDYLKQIFVDNFFHADPHPGNLLLGPRGHVVYLDFGAVGQLGDEARRGMLRLYRAVLDSDVDSAVQAMLRLAGMEIPDVEREGLREDMDRILFLCRSRPGSRWTDELIETARRHGIPLPRSVLALAKGLVLMESLALELAPDFGFFAELEAMKWPVVARAVEAELQGLPRALEDAAEAVRGLPTVLHRLADAGAPAVRGARPPAAG